jgi:hypothetical protein
MQATKLETAILDWIADRQLPLAARMNAVEIAGREHTGAGRYVYLSDEGPDWDRPPVDGPMIESPQLAMGAGSLLWLSQGEAHCLEIYAFGNHFPEALDEFTLSGADGSV